MSSTQSRSEVDGPGGIELAASAILSIAILVGASIITAVAMLLDVPHSSTVWGWPLGRGWDFLVGPAWAIVNWWACYDGFFPDRSRDLSTEGDERHETVCLITLLVTGVIGAAFGILLGAAVLIVANLFLWLDRYLRWWRWG